MKAAGAAVMAAPAASGPAGAVPAVPGASGPAGAAPARKRIVAWSGHSWRVRPAAWDGLPGPNRWSAANVSVDGGVLRLEINQRRRGWTCAEVHSRRSFGYGRYRFVVGSDLSRLDPWVVLGLFTYRDDIPQPHNEIDIEVARWGRRRDRRNAQFVQQPRGRGNTKRLALPPRPPYTMWWDWVPGSIAWGVIDGTGDLVSAHSRPSPFVPSGERVHLNLWLAEGHPPARPLAIEVASFDHTPL
jgi:hypothetical protein